MEKWFLLFILFGQQAFGLTPLEGVILGKIQQDDQFDPMKTVFERKSQNKDVTDSELMLRNYLAFYQSGENLKNSCDKYTTPFRYASPWLQSQAEQTVLATLQYMALDLQVRAIAKYAKHLEYTSSDYNRLVDNIIQGYCSKNLTVYSLKLLKQNLLDKFENNNSFNLPNWNNSPHFPENLQSLSQSNFARTNEFNYTLKGFRAFCSWSGSVDDFRLLDVYLQNPHLMSYVFQHMDGKESYFDYTSHQLKYRSSQDTIQVLCKNGICRKADYKSFEKLFPRMMGSSSLKSDLERLYCQRFSQINIDNKSPLPVIAKWKNERTLESINLERSQLIALITGAPDLLNSVEKYVDLVRLLKSNINQRLSKWAKASLNQFSNDMYYEESLQFQVMPKNARFENIRGKYHIDVEVTLGEIDRGTELFDKLTAYYSLKFPKSFLDWAKKEYMAAKHSGKTYRIENFEKQIQEYVKNQLINKEKRFVVLPWDQEKNPGGNLEKIITPELLRQLELTDEKFFAKNVNDFVEVPVEFHYGNFALKYLRYRFNKVYR
ncbi:MAG: hypothetical protein JNM93_11240 [Bacteriovoracaceae bacterium]|nr:hypothetical protein [Bacteriovoracaceae bacterium]